MRSERVAFRVTKSMKEKLENLSNSSDKSMSDLMNAALEDFVLGGPKIEMNDRLEKVESELESIKTDILELRNSLRGLVAQLETFVGQK